MLKENLTELHTADRTIEEVDLDYTFLVDDVGSSVYIKFDGFRDELQMEQFANFMEQHLPLIFTNSTKH
jgi:hypothetical protein